MEKAAELLLSHVLIAGEKYPHARFLVVIERNLRGVPIVLAGALSGLSSYVDFFQESPRLVDFGYEKRELPFAGAMYQLQRCLINNQVQFAADLVCAGMHESRTLDILRRQCLHYTPDCKQARRSADTPPGDFDLVESLIINFGIAHDIVHHVYPNPSDVQICNPP